MEVDFSEKTEIRGKNRCGKSTLMNAYFDVMTGKFANGTAPTNICPWTKTEKKSLSRKSKERLLWKSTELNTKSEK